MLQPQIFKANDIRGIVAGEDPEWDLDGARRLGAAFVQLLDQEWPGGIADDTPWKYAPLAQDAAGNLFDTALRWGADDAAARICALAEREGLVFFDPQHPDLRGRFRPRWEQ